MTLADVRWIAVASGQAGQRLVHAQRVAASPLAGAWRQAIGGSDPDESTIHDNRIAQPTIAAWQLDAYAAMAPRLPPPVLVAGYSVGEIAACVIAGGFTAADAIAVAAGRARCMDAAAPYACALAAVLGLAQREVEAIGQRHDVAIAIRNGPRHFVIGGARANVDAAIDDASAAGATRAHALRVNTPAHTPLLASAVEPFAAIVDATVRAPLRLPMISAIDAARIVRREEVVGALSRQLATALDWAACMDAIVEMQPDAILEIGPCNALSRMFAEAHPEASVRALEDFHDPAAAAAWVGSRRR